MQSCDVVCRARSLVEVSAVIVTAWLVDAHVLSLLSGHCGVLSVSGWMFKHSPSRVCETAPTAAGATFEQRRNTGHQNMLLVS